MVGMNSQEQHHISVSTLMFPTISVETLKWILQVIHWVLFHSSEVRSMFSTVKVNVFLTLQERNTNITISMQNWCPLTMVENALMVCLVAFIAICVASILSSKEQLENAYQSNRQIIWEKVD